jgi:hypothetical protein
VRRVTHGTAYKVLIGKPEGKRMLCGRIRHRWEDNIKIDHVDASFVKIGSSSGLQ